MADRSSDRNPPWLAQGGREESREFAESADSSPTGHGGRCADVTNCDVDFRPATGANPAKVPPDWRDAKPALKRRGYGQGSSWALFATLSKAKNDPISHADGS
jgi:hypothetical protein